MTGVPQQATLADDRTWAFEAVQSVSRTFALSVELLDEPMTEWVCTGYLLCRTADTIEDEPTIPMQRRAELLETFDAMLAEDDETTVEDFLAAVEPETPADGGDDWAVLGQTDRIVRLWRSFPDPVQDGMRSITREMATGMADILRRHEDSGGLRLETLDELEEYCWYVAGTVGQLFMNLQAAGADPDDPTPDPEDARAFALLLQLVNIAKDVRADWDEENNVYLPGEWLAEEELDHEAVAEPEHSTAVAGVVGRVVDQAADYAHGAQRYLSTVPEGDNGGLLEATALPYLLALGTIRELRERTVDAVEQPDAVKLEREEVEALFAEAEDGFTRDQVRDLAATVRAGPYHEQ
ncbi:squalene/phytoene synthase family protein [Halomicrobium sp. LC1Hm]|uniref:phytoene/squalene synthase family protein n=1 Tax=Halomicrobium sp. LC1Hm TaxID=2610902 RepID=UPI0012984EF4|nr:squalene/phytoene synthase family protein [Halomicrobium sp. LC1Hm]